MDLFSVEAKFRASGTVFWYRIFVFNALFEYNITKGFIPSGFPFHKYMLRF